MTARLSQINKRRAVTDRAYSVWCTNCKTIAEHDAMAAVLIRGGGIAASCCAHLLSEAGLKPATEKLDRSKLPAVMLSAGTQQLLRDVFGREDLLVDLPQIRKRIVAWGPDAKPLILPHSAVVLSEEQLLDRIQEGLEQNEHGSQQDPEWTIVASTNLCRKSIEHAFGRRIAAASPVTLKTTCDQEACWIESLERGWLFLLPKSEDNGWLLSVGDSVQALLGTSRLIGDQIQGMGASRGAFPSHPRIAMPLSETGWLACGTAALGFDPLCGDGTGNAIREAILASAVVRAAVNGFDVESLVMHYQTRLLAGFRRHLASCFDFYKTGHGGSWWGEQLTELQHGLQWCMQQLSGCAAYRYRLNGFTLEAANDEFHRA